MRKKMKVAFVINSLRNRNGAAVFLMDLLDDLASKACVDLILITLYDKIDESFLKGINSNQITLLQCHKRRKVDLKSAKLFKKYISEFNPDVINIHLPILFTYFLAFGFKKMPWKLVKTYHSIPGQDSNAFNIFLEKEYVRKNLLDFVAISKSIGNKSQSLYPGAITKVINNGIKLPRALLFNGEKKYDFVIVASLEEVKNHMLLFRAFEKILGRKKDVKLAVVGDGSKKSEYIEYVNSRNLSQNIHFLGQITNVGEILSQSSIFVLSSIREGNPISLLEAMSYGLAVVVPNVGGIPDIVSHKENGLLYACNSETELEESMLTILEDKSMLRTMSQNNIEKSKEFSIERTGDEYVEYFEEIISKESERKDK